MIYARGHPLDYDCWRQKGLPGWSYADVLPYFRKLETSWRGGGHFHGEAGPVGVIQSRLPGLQYEDLEQAAAAAGVQPAPDLNGETPEGISRMELTVLRGLRASSASAYLDPVRSRPGLVLATNARLEKVMFTGRRAVGVAYRQGGEPRTAYANREVILCGGAYGSPQMLMLSGVGPADHLRSMGLDVIVDSPEVGGNLQEHVLAPMAFRAAHTRTFLRSLRLDRAAAAAVEWLVSRGGPLTSNGVGANIYHRTLPELERPDIRLICGSIGPDAGLWFPGLGRQPAHQYICAVNLLHPLSRGRVWLRSPSPIDLPRVRFGLLSEDADVRTLVRGLRLARAIYGADPMARNMAGELTPGSAVASDEALTQYVRATAAIGQHPVGTCRMGGDENAVLDAELRVRGVESLRVVDASVFPEQIGGNPNVPIMMIAEVAADLIRGRRRHIEGGAPEPAR